ncbi:hypothetical protein BT63DRAFT_421866 [Microthyrium microscopicum]|uniref:Major facilitator superfamily transporter n=1 Tax=Microthyrium microscopicum TaxID=703497 RepID=A0A6A6UN92_9PEZI|nr:hypothetical protein BT63DRAFT_421866 [Microthyrium microscopicum]
MNSADSDDSLHDLEKRHSIDSDYEYSSASSRNSMHSDTRILSSQYETHQPILGDCSSPRHARSRQTRIRFPLSRQTLCVCTPKKFTRYFAIIIFSVLIIFILTLFKLSGDSARSVSLGLNKPKAPPPPWTKFPFLKRYHGGIRSLVNVKDNVPEYPSRLDDALPKSESEDSGKQEQPQDALPPSVPFDYGAKDASIVECYLDAEKKTKLPDVRVYSGIPKGMPDAVMGSHDVLGLNRDVCFERFGRLGPYGFGYEKKKGGSGAGMEGHKEGADDVWSETGHIDFRKVNWRTAQETCLTSNGKRFRKATDSRPKNHLNQKRDKAAADDGLLPRQAIIIRTWTDYEYDDEDLFYLRSLVWELSLKTGGQYEVHFLIHVKDGDLPIWADEEVYAKVLKESLPAEFAGMGTLWSEKQMEMIYNSVPENQFRDLPLHGVYRSLHMPLAWFSHNHPEFENVWHFEMDMRYTGQYHHFISQVEQWATKQPRKGLWERNARFYVPAEHGSWEDFSHMVRVQTEHGTNSKANMFSGLLNDPSVPSSVKEEMTIKAEKAVWGPEPPYLDKMDNSTDIFPPRPMSQDKSEWGVGEEADLIVFNPLFDPQGTNWLLSEDTTGYNKTYGPPPRRTAVTTFGRYSHRLLSQMHRDMATFGRHMFSEMFPATTALHHGYKAVYVPHPVYIDRNWPTDYLAATFNGGRNGQSGGSRMSVFSEENEHNFAGVTWYYNAGFAPNLWHRWLGYKVDNDGGEAEEVQGEGRMCLPAMLIHPVKQVDLIYQENGAEEDGK